MIEPRASSRDITFKKALRAAMQSDSERPVPASVMLLTRDSMHLVSSWMVCTMKFFFTVGK